MNIQTSREIFLRESREKKTYLTFYILTNILTYRISPKTTSPKTLIFEKKNRSNLFLFTWIQ